MFDKETRELRIKPWFLCFKFKYGAENREVVLRSFMNFLANPGKEMWIPPGHCMLGGNLYGSDLYSDDTQVVTSEITSITKVSKTKRVFGLSRTLFKATTETESEYFFWSDEESPYMFIMKGDLTYLNLLSSQAGRYVPPEYRAKGLL